MKRKMREKKKSLLGRTGSLVRRFTSEISLSHLIVMILSSSRSSSITGEHRHLWTNQILMEAGGRWTGPTATRQLGVSIETPHLEKEIKSFQLAKNDPLVRNSTSPRQIERIPDTPRSTTGWTNGWGSKTGSWRPRSKLMRSTNS